MREILEGSERPISDMLERGGSYLPGFFEEDRDALDEATTIMHASMETNDQINDVEFGELRHLPTDNPFRHLGQKALHYIMDSYEVREGLLPPPYLNPRVEARHIQPSVEFGWHRDDILLGNWVVPIMVIAGSGRTEVGGVTPFIGRLNPIQIESQTADLLLIRGRFMHNLPVPYERALPLHKVVAGRQGRITASLF